MRIATWNVNSLKARMERLLPWLERIAPDILLIQETKLTDKDAGISRAILAKVGYELAHHGEGGGRNGVAIASKTPITDVLVNFGEALHTPAKTASGDIDPFAEARMIAATVAGIQIICLYAPNGRVVDTAPYFAKLAWYARLAEFVANTHKTDDALIVGGDMNLAPDERDVWDATACHGGTHVSVKERDAFKRLLDWGLADAYRTQTEQGERYTWWDYRAGDFYKNFGMRIDHLLLSRSVASRVIAAEIDREARKGKPTPSDHAPFVMDLDIAGKPFDAGWAGADERIQARRRQSEAKKMR